MDNEIWQPVPGYEGLYEASTLGRVRSVRRYAKRGKGMAWIGGHILNPVIHRTGYCQTGLSKEGKLKNFLVHRIIALTFIGECPAEMEVCHGDGVKTNNCLTNLRYGTRLENAADKRKHGTGNEGETNARANLDAETVLRIYDLCCTGSQQLDVARELGVSPVTVNHIATGRTWGSVTGAKWKRSHQVVTPELVTEMNRLQFEGKTLDQIAAELNVSRPTVFRHTKGRSWTEKFTMENVCL